jgi:hypothetical protein
LKVVDVDYTAYIPKNGRHDFNGCHPNFPFFGADSPPEIHCFDCCLVSGGFVVDPRFIHGYKTAQKLDHIAVENRLTFP